MQIGQILKRLRQDGGLTQKEFAAMLPIQQSYLSQIENGLKVPNMSTIEKIGQHIDIPAPTLVLLSLSAEDVPRDKRKLLSDLQEGLYQVVLRRIQR